MPRSRPKPSPVFALLERLEVDVDVGAVLRWSDGTEEVVRADHRGHDGLSAAALLLDAAGYRARPPERRLLVDGDVRWRDWPGVFRRFQVDFRDRQVPWVEEHPVEGRVPPLTAEDPGFGWIEWDAPTSRRIMDACKTRDVSLNALMLWGLNRAVMPLVAEGETSFPWIMPVDLRRRGRADAAETVATSGVMLDLGAAHLPEEVHAQLVEKVLGQSHLAYWFVTERLTRRLPAQVLWPILRDKEGGGNRCMGGCTYLGDLSAWVEEPPPGRHIETAVGFNLLSRQFPVQSVGLRWEGKLTFSLRMHPLIWAGDVSPLIEEWQATVESEVGLHPR